MPDPDNPTPPPSGGSRTASLTIPPLADALKSAKRKIVKATNQFWVGILGWEIEVTRRGKKRKRMFYPVHNVTAGGVSFPVLTYSLEESSEEIGVQRRGASYTGDTIALSQDDVDRIFEYVGRHVLRPKNADRTSFKLIDTGIRSWNSRANNGKGGPGAYSYKPRATDEPLARHLFMVPVEDYQEEYREKKAPPSMEELYLKKR